MIYEEGGRLVETNMPMPPVLMSVHEALNAIAA